ncbi:hypothetical protein ACWD0A_12890 [Streptomyces sp. NPDC002867]
MLEVDGAPDREPYGVRRTSATPAAGRTPLPPQPDPQPLTAPPTTGKG